MDRTYHELTDPDSRLAILSLTLEKKRAAVSAAGQERQERSQPIHESEIC